MGQTDMLRNAAAELRKLAAQVSDLKAEIAGYEKQNDAEKIAMDMADKGMLSVEEVKNTAQTWIEQEKDLGTLEEAVKMAEAIPSSTWAGSGMSAGGSGSPEDSFTDFIQYEMGK